MSYNQVYHIAAAGMEIEKLRFEIAAHNISNQYTLRNIDGSSFQPKQLIVSALPFDSILTESLKGSVAKVDIVPENLPPNKVYQPNHPEADQEGYINYPGLNTVDEMTTLLRASRTYEANIKIMNMAKSMYMQALSIGEER
ncbi:flagellar basal body rod protein FlgC [Legionella israelensis]|uniref:flagellar basal body rod protein FlgC n=1 Tax=Legionella israelensis TaxID=454 RepID=UPI00117E3A0F|nr:flagellar basal body rod protein FlgC [Legionella israelensis]QDP72911.1 flagellar basal body rod protein FlgC [Legionella israelensis]